METGTWSGLSLPLFAVLLATLKGQPRNVAAWVYLWCLGGVYLFVQWQGYHLYLAGQQLELGSIKPNALSGYLEDKWTGNVFMGFLMALPPVLYWHDKHKLLKQNGTRS